jgi:anaphase-promoting complex subunit 7
VNYKNNFCRSLFFAHKACTLDRRNVEALLLKGNILLDMKKLQDAMNHFREAVVLAPHRYETHKVILFKMSAINSSKNILAFYSFRPLGQQWLGHTKK